MGTKPNAKMFYPLNLNALLSNHYWLIKSSIEERANVYNNMHIELILNTMLSLLSHYEFSLASLLSLLYRVIGSIS